MNTIHVHPSGTKEGRSLLWVHNQGRVPVTLVLEGYESHLVLDGQLRLAPGSLVPLSGAPDEDASLAVIAVDDAPLPQAEPVLLPGPRDPAEDGR